jgi:hypothetical protein
MTLTPAELDGLEQADRRSRELWGGRASHMLPELTDDESKELTTLLSNLRAAHPVLLSAARTLSKVLPVVEACIAYPEETGWCKFCDYHLNDVKRPHGEDCPLVVAELVTRDGRRVGVPDVR